MPPELRHGWVRGNAWLWAGVWSTLFTGFFLRMLYLQSCAILLGGREFVWPVASLVWLWLLVFFGLGNRGRAVYVICCFLLWGITFTTAHITRIPGAAAEARAIAELRAMAGAVRAAGQDRLSAGFPRTLPQMASAYIQKLYRLDYRTSQSKPEGPIDGFVLELTPIYRECGTIRSFTAAEDGQFYFTFEDRAATKADTRISPP